MRPGDRIILYTDGIVEAKNKTGRMIGTRGFLKAIQKHHNLAIEEMVDQTMNTITSSAVEGFEDDVTMVVVEYLEETSELQEVG